MKQIFTTKLCELMIEFKKIYDETKNICTNISCAKEGEIYITFKFNILDKILDQIRKEIDIQPSYSRLNQGRAHFLLCIIEDIIHRYQELKSNVFAIFRNNCAWIGKDHGTGLAAL